MCQEYLQGSNTIAIFFKYFVKNQVPGFSVRQNGIEHKFCKSFYWENLNGYQLSFWNMWPPSFVFRGYSHLRKEKWYFIKLSRGKLTLLNNVFFNFPYATMLRVSLKAPLYIYRHSFKPIKPIVQWCITSKWKTKSENWDGSDF